MRVHVVRKYIDRPFFVHICLSPPCGCPARSLFLSFSLALSLSLHTAVRSPSFGVRALAGLHVALVVMQQAQPHLAARTLLDACGL